MTRRRLWVATTACCALLALPTLAHLTSLVAPGVSWRSVLDTAGRIAPSASHELAAMAAWSRQAHVPSRLGDLWHMSAHTVLVLALMIALMAWAVLVTDRLRQARRAGAPQRARHLAERGAGIGAIARRTGLPQDAVRQLLHPQQERDRAAFAELLAASRGTRDARLAYAAAPRTVVPPNTGSRSNR